MAGRTGNSVGLRCPAQRLSGDGRGGPEQGGAGYRGADLVSGELVLGASHHHGTAAVGRAQGRGRGRGRDRGIVSGVDRGRQARTGHRGYRGLAAEFGDQPALIFTCRRGDRRPDRDRTRYRGGRLDRRNGADHGDVRLELGSKGVERVHASRVARHHDDIRLVARSGPRDPERALRYVLRCPRPPRHPVRVHCDDQIRIRAKPVQLAGGSQQPEPGVDEREPHPITVKDARLSFG